METKYTDVPGCVGSHICTCECHMEHCNVMHCRPCCDKTYEPYSPELWNMIPELQGILDQMSEKLKNAK